MGFSEYPSGLNIHALIFSDMEETDQIQMAVELLREAFPLLDKDVADYVEGVFTFCTSHSQGFLLKMALILILKQMCTML